MTDKTQEQWPFGPAPKRECAAGGEHDWRIINLFGAAEPPAPSFECAKCGWKWSRPWTQAEFDAWLARQGDAAREYFGVCHYPAEPAYAADVVPTSGIVSVDDIEFFRLVAGQWRELRLSVHQLRHFEAIIERLARSLDSGGREL